MTLVTHKIDDYHILCLSVQLFYPIEIFTVKIFGFGCISQLVEYFLVCTLIVREAFVFSSSPDSLYSVVVFVVIATTFI